MANTKREINEKTPLMILAGPMFGELLLNILVNNVDTMMLSHYSQNAVGAVGNANQIMFFLNLTFNIIATATSVVVAQYLGAKQHDKMNMIYTLAMFVNCISGLLFSGAFVLSKRLILHAIDVPEIMLQDAYTYINIVGGTMVFLALYNVMLQILRCNGYAYIGTIISVMINVINVVGNWLFLYGPLKFLNFGVAGVALATATARIVALIVAIVFFYVKKIGRFGFKYLRPFPFKMLGNMIKIGLPSAGENMSYNLYQIFLLRLINGMGPEAVNAKVYSASLVSLSMVFSNSAAMATQIITGHLVGAGKEDAAYKRVFSTLKISLPVTIGMSTLNWLLSPYSLRFFTDNSQVIKFASMIMLVDIVIEIGRCLNMTFVSSLKAAGDYVFPLVVGLIMMWGIGATVGYTMGVVVGVGVAGVFMGTASDEFLRGLVTMWRWRSGKWRGRALVKAKKADAE